MDKSSRIQRSLKCLIVAIGLCCFVSHGVAGTRVEIVALFKQKALLLIDGQKRFLNVGSISPEGVKLISATSKSAEVEWNGSRRSLNLTRTISSGYATPKQKGVLIQRTPRGQYLTSGSINGMGAQFLVDTGANVVALNSYHAARIGIDYRSNGTKVMMATASGLVPAYEIEIDQIMVGDISVSNVRATVIEGSFPQDILLGMTFLTHVDMQEKNGLMSLQKKY